MVTLRTLLKHKRYNIVIEFPSLIIPAFAGKYRGWPAVTLPMQRYWLKTIADYGDESLSVSLVDDKLKHYNFNIVETAKVAVVKEEHDRYQAIMDVYNREHLKDILGHSFTIGSDPEVFLTDRNGKVLPAFKFLGSKAEKKTVTVENMAVYWDGFQAEFETVANTCLAYHVDSIQKGLALALKQARVVDEGARLSTATTLPIDHEELMAAKEEHVEFGCMPSFNVYGMEGMKLPGREVPFRSAGGHIHFGIGKLSPKTDAARIKRIVKALDAVLGVACVSLFAKYDEPGRRSMYGLAGEYRLPPHGLEYRTLSNAWMVHPVITHLVFDLSRKALMLGQNNLLRFWEGNEKETIEIVNACNVDGARIVLKRNEKVFKQILSSAYPNLTSPQVHVLYTIFLEGMESVINPEEMEKSWKIGNVGVDAWIRHSDGKNQCVKMMIESIATPAKKKEEAA